MYIKNKIQKTALTLAVLATLSGCSLSEKTESEINTPQIKLEQESSSHKSLIGIEKEVLKKVKVNILTEKETIQSKSDISLQLDDKEEVKNTIESIKIPDQFVEQKDIEPKYTEEKEKTVDTPIIVENKNEEEEKSIDTPVIVENKNEEEEKSKNPEVVITPQEENNPEINNDKSDVDKTPITGGTTSKPGRPTHKHIYVWSMLNDTTEKGTCSCGNEITREHTLSEWTYTEREDSRNCLTCDYIETKEHEHTIPEEWEYIENNMDSKTCSTCGYTETREHIHLLPENIEYILKESKNDGTHTLECNYTCETCSQDIIDTKTENCSYGDQTVVKDHHLNEPYNQHVLKEACEICGYTKEYIEDCVKAGELKCIKINNTIFEYYECAICEGYIDRKIHTTHTFGEWEISDDKHIRYCTCIEGREEGKHEFEFIFENPNSTYVTSSTCGICGYSKPIARHQHAIDEMNFMDIVQEPFFNDLIGYSPIANPNPDPNDYCTRLDLICRSGIDACGANYSIYYKHDFDGNGYCTADARCYYNKNSINDIIQTTPSNEINTELPEETVTPDEVITETPEEIVTPDEIITETPEEIVTPDEIITETPEEIVTPDEIITETPEEIVTPDEIITETLEEEIKEDAVSDTEELLDALYEYKEKLISTINISSEEEKSTSLKLRKKAHN